MRILLLAGSSTSPSARFRVWQFVEPLRALGHEVEVRITRPDRHWPACNTPNGKLNRMSGSLLRSLSAVWITRDIEDFDVVLMHRDLVPNPRIDQIEPWLATRNRRLIFDFDDAIFLGARGRKLAKILPCFKQVTVGNEHLATFARRYHRRVAIWPTVVDTERYQPVANRAAGPLRIGWSGSRSTMHHCLPLLKDAICSLAKTMEFELVVMSESTPSLDWPGVRQRYIRWTPQTEVSSLQQLDLGLMPLADQAFERGKCGLKAIQYMAVGVPALVSPVGVNREIVLHGETGFHCHAHEEWMEAISFLAYRPNLRRQMGMEGRRRVSTSYSRSSLLPNMLEVFEAVSQ